MSVLAEIYAKDVFAGRRGIEAVPEMFRDEARKALEDLNKRAEAQAQREVEATEGVEVNE
ncbi:hypothetical protein HB825_03675 [Listeria booriae]|uniref:CD1375 family protein n=1 Tax=Listeria booriae TaxID=1552123 RepID=UPI0016259D5E|nr:CD1375 family protein [Listeria booriae]MBC1919430.1 hypothetical protein [Listeria booriae]MBC6133931.1 hypothetical protein [Listeria booriae]